MIAHNHLQLIGLPEGFSIVSTKNASLLWPPFRTWQCSRQHPRGQMLLLAHCHQSPKIHCSPWQTYPISIFSYHTQTNAHPKMHVLCQPSPLITHFLLWEGISFVTNSCLSNIHWIQAVLANHDKRTNEPTQMWWKASKRFTPSAIVKWSNPEWDVTVVDTMASSYMPTTSVTPCEAAKAAALQKNQVPGRLTLSNCTFCVQIVFETLRTIRASSPA